MTNLCVWAFFLFITDFPPSKMDGTWKYFWQPVHNIKWCLVLWHSAVGNIFSWYVLWIFSYLQWLSFLIQTVLCEVFKILHIKMYVRNPLWVVLLYGISDSSVRCEVIYSPKVLFSFGMDFFVVLFGDFVFGLFICFCNILFSVKLNKLCENLLWKSIGLPQQDWFSV